MNKFIISSIMCLGLTSGVAFSNPEISDKEVASIQMAAAGVTPFEKEADANANGKNDLLDVHWDFITCVHDNHECYDEATYHGYHHYKAVHDNHLCHGHAHYACYGGHH